MRPLVLDTNIVLDLLVFQDPLTEPLRQALQQNHLNWISTQAMRDEFKRVLAYPQIARRLQLTSPGDTVVKNFNHSDSPAQITPAADAMAQVLARFDAQVRLVPAAGKAPVTCGDPDDQKFIDLAVFHKALLLSKDRAVICMKKRLLTLDVHALTAIDKGAISGLVLIAVRLGVGKTVHQPRLAQTPAVGAVAGGLRQINPVWPTDDPGVATKIGQHQPQGLHERHHHPLSGRTPHS